MKNLTVLLISLLIGLLTISCKKTAEIKPSINGIWKGKFGIGPNTEPNTDVIFELKADGTILVYNGADIPTATTKGTGSYKTLNGGLEMAAEYTYPNNQLIYSVQMTTTSEYKTLKGTWKFNTTPGGKIEFTKQ